MAALVLVRSVGRCWRISGVWEELRRGPGGEPAGGVHLGPFSVQRARVMSLTGSTGAAGVAPGPSKEVGGFAASSSVVLANALCNRDDGRFLPFVFARRFGCCRRFTPGKTIDTPCVPPKRLALEMEGNLTHSTRKLLWQIRLAWSKLGGSRVLLFSGAAHPAVL